MTETATEEKTGILKAEEWAERISAQQRSGVSVKQFCRENGWCATMWSWIPSPRLEEGAYAVPFGDAGGEPRREITAQELGALLSGIDLSTAQRRKGTRVRIHKTLPVTVVFIWK